MIEAHIGKYVMECNRGNDWEIGEADYLPTWLGEECVVVQYWHNRSYGFRGFTITPPVLPDPEQEGPEECPYCESCPCVCSTRCKECGDFLCEKHLPPE